MIIVNTTYLIVCLVSSLSGVPVAGSIPRLKDGPSPPGSVTSEDFSVSIEGFIWCFSSSPKNIDLCFLNWLLIIVFKFRHHIFHDNWIMTFIFINVLIAFSDYICSHVFLEGVSNCILLYFSFKSHTIKNAVKYYW